MPALNFKAQFAPAVEAGTKRQTIRAPRKQSIRVGDTLHLFTGMRQKSCRKLRTVTCSQVRPIEIDKAVGLIWMPIAGKARLLDAAEADQLAQRDGFRDRIEMAEWFRSVHGLPFKGQLIEWENDEGQPRGQRATPVGTLPKKD